MQPLCDVGIQGQVCTKLNDLQTKLAQNLHAVQRKQESYISTIGVDFKIRTLEQDGKTIKLQLLGVGLEV